MKPTNASSGSSTLAQNVESADFPTDPVERKKEAETKMYVLKLKQSKTLMEMELTDGDGENAFKSGDQKHIF